MAQQQQQQNRPTTPPRDLPPTPAYFAGNIDNIITTIKSLDEDDAEYHLNIAKSFLRHLKNLGTSEKNVRVRKYRFIIKALREHLYILKYGERDTLTSSESEGGGIFENYKKLNPLSGAGFFDELAKMRTPEGQDRSYCSRSFAMYRFPKGEYEKAMTSCMAKRKKERESKTEGNGIPLVALAGIARQFRGHL